MTEDDRHEADKAEQEYLRLLEEKARRQQPRRKRARKLKDRVALLEKICAILLRTEK